MYRVSSSPSQSDFVGPIDVLIDFFIEQTQSRGLGWRPNLIFLCHLPNPVIVSFGKESLPVKRK
jgi:hypothetical protein